INCTFEIIRLEIALVGSVRRADRSGVPTSRLQFVFCNGNKWERGRLREFTHDFIYRFHRPRVNLLNLAILEECVHYDFQAAQPMVENQDGAWNHQERLGQSKFILMRERNFGFKKVDRFVANETNGAACKPRQFRARYKLIAVHQLSHFIDWAPAY